LPNEIDYYPCHVSSAKVTFSLTLFEGEVGDFSFFGLCGSTLSVEVGLLGFLFLGDPELIDGLSGLTGFGDASSFEDFFELVEEVSIFNFAFEFVSFSWPVQS
jgi:hypothetical protein